MIATIGRKIGSLSITLHDGSAAGTAIFTRIPGAIPAIDQVIELLNEIERAHDEEPDRADWKRLKADGTLWKYDAKAFVRREHWRYRSYVVEACALVGVLARQFNQLCRELRTFRPAVASTLEPKSAILYQRMSTYRKLRNKIYAHTAFADPKPDDNRSMMATSLMQWGYLSFQHGPNGVIPGGGMIVYEGEKDPKLPAPPDFSTLAADTAALVVDWAMAIADVMQELAVVDPSEWKRANKFIQEVGWDPP